MAFNRLIWSSCNKKKMSDSQLTVTNLIQVNRMWLSSISSIAWLELNWIIRAWRGVSALEASSWNLADQIWWEIQQIRALLTDKLIFTSEAMVNRFKHGGTTCTRKKKTGITEEIYDVPSRLPKWIFFFSPPFCSFNSVTVIAAATNRSTKVTTDFYLSPGPSPIQFI